MEFILTYPHVQKPPADPPSEDWSNGLDLLQHHQHVLGLVRQTAALCSGPDKRVSLTVEGFANNQPPLVPDEEQDHHNLNYANLRAANAFLFLCGLDDVPSDATCSALAPDASDSMTPFKVSLNAWPSHDEMEKNRPETTDQRRMRFLHRSVRVKVDDAGSCPPDEATSGEGEDETANQPEERSAPP